MRDREDWEDWQGTRRFQVLSILGAGGMGGVYRCHDRELDREVAVKRLLPHRCAPGSVRERLRREARAMARVRHPHLLRVYDVCQEGRTLFLVLELVRGRSLAEEIDGFGPLELDRALGVGNDLAGALAALHREGVQHRDLKPANVMLEEGGRTLLMDLGLAQIEGTETLTQEGTMVGTPTYLPPEVVMGGEWSPAADQYQLGALLFECLTGVPLVPGDSVPEILASLRQGTQRTLPPGLAPPEVMAVLERATSLLPGERYQTMARFERRLRGRLSSRGGGLGATAPGLPASGERAPGEAVSREMPETSPSAGSRKRGRGTRAGSPGRARRRWRLPVRSPFLRGLVFSMTATMLLLGLFAWHWSPWLTPRGETQVSPSGDSSASPGSDPELEHLLEPFQEDPAGTYLGSPGAPDAAALAEARRRLGPALERLGRASVSRATWQALQRAQRSRILALLRGGEDEPALQPPAGRVGHRGQEAPGRDDLALEIREEPGRGGEARKIWARLRPWGTPRLPGLDHASSSDSLVLGWPGERIPPVSRVTLTVTVRRLARDCRLELRWLPEDAGSARVEVFPPVKPRNAGNPGLHRGPLSVSVPRDLLPGGAAELVIRLLPQLGPTLHVADLEAVHVSWSGDPGPASASGGSPRDPDSR